MKLIKEFLTKYANEKFLEENYDYKFDINHKIFSEGEISRLNQEVNWFHKNVVLKEIIQEKIRQNKNNKDLFFWIIKEWGKIRSFKSFNKIEIKLKELKEGKLSTGTTISSFSKIFSFSDIDNYFIYDSRTIFTLNWLILKYQLYPKIKYFPQPSGRNTIIKNYSIEALINFYYLYYKNITKPKDLYYSENEAYKKYVEFIKHLNTGLWTDESQKPPYYLEMLLFALSVEKVLPDIKESINISIDSLMEQKEGA